MATHASMFRTALAAAFVLALQGACIGNLGGNALQGGGSGVAGGSGADGGSTTVDTGSLVNATNLAASPVQMRHLLKRELLASMNDLVGPTPSVDSSLLPADVIGSGYDNDVSAQTIDATLLTGYLTVASQAANDVVTTSSAATFAGCGRALTTSCVQSFVTNFGLRVYRRPLTDDEVSAYMALYASESVPADGLRQVVRTFFASPNFFYQPEIGTSAAEKPGYLRLTGFERATRLSLLLTGMGPSADLLKKAATGELDDAEGVAAAAKQLITSDQGARYLRYFAQNWLKASAATGSVVSAKGLANDSVQLRADMAEETLRLFDDFAKPGADFFGLLSADYTYVSPSLAAVYGVTPAADGNWTKVSLAGKPRAGVLTQPGILYAAAGAGPVVIRRGLYVLQRLLCVPVGSPPVNVGGVTTTAADGHVLTDREALAAHSANPSCAACHDLIDPIGFGFERYDEVGNYATVDKTGAALTGAGAVTGTSGFSFTDGSELGQKLASLQQTKDCVASKLSAYMMGHTPADEDAATVTMVSQNLSKYGLVAAVLSYVQSDSFLYRKA